MACTSAIVVLQYINNLKRELVSTDSNQDKNISHNLSALKIELDKKFSVRVIARKEGLYPLLIEMLSKLENQDLLQVLETLTSLTNGQSDLLDKFGLDYMIAFLSTSTDKSLTIQNIKWMKNCVTANDKNRSSLVRLGVQSQYKNLLKKYSEEPELMVEICQAVKSLVSDDDSRMIHGNPHEHAALLAGETLSGFISCLYEHQNDAAILGEVFQVINILLVGEEFCIKFYEQNGLNLTMDFLVKYHDDERLNALCLLILKALAASDELKKIVVGKGAAPLIVRAMYRHKSSPKVASAGCVCISALALRSRSNARRLVEAGAGELLTATLTIHGDNANVLKNNCWAIRNLVSRCREHVEIFAGFNLGPLLKDACRKFGKEVRYEVATVMRELQIDFEDG